MANPAPIRTVTMVSTGLGLISLFGYLYFEIQVRAVSRSIRDLVDGKGPFEAKEIERILRRFKTDEQRLPALTKLLDTSRESAQSILDKVKGEIDLQKFSRRTSKDYRLASASTAAVFLLLALIGLLYPEEQLATPPVAIENPDATPKPQPTRKAEPTAPDSCGITAGRVGRGKYEVKPPFVYSPELGMLEYAHPKPDGNFDTMMTYTSPAVTNVDFDSFETPSFTECLNRCLDQELCEAAEIGRAHV